MSASNKLSSALVDMFAARPVSWSRAPTLLEIELMARELRDCRRTAKTVREQVKQLEAQLERYRFIERARQPRKAES